MGTISSEFGIRQLTPAIGAELTGINLSAPLPETTLDAIYDALIQHHVIFFPPQSISVSDHLAFARSFGEPEPPHPVYPHHPESEHVVVLHNGPDNPPNTDGWHSDVTFQQTPPFASVLWARQVPRVGGDTLWTSLISAYDALPMGIQSEIEELNAVHDLGDYRNDFSRGETDGARLVEAHQKFGSAIHPLVQTHPVSKRKFVFANEGFTQHIVGLKASDSSHLLSYLYHHINQPEHQVRYHWSDGALAMWDNRCTWHYATADYLPHERIMHRITVLNDRRRPR
tara:strand:- start:133 stop:984 length:852 start_codon:yes stop_codon:yes gene_type:complete